MRVKALGFTMGGVIGLMVVHLFAIAMQERGKVVEYSRGVASRPLQDATEYVTLSKDQLADAKVAVARCEAALAKYNEEEARLALLLHALSDELKVPPGYGFSRERLQFIKLKTD